MLTNITLLRWTFGLALGLLLQSGRAAVINVDLNGKDGTDDPQTYDGGAAGGPSEGSNFWNGVTVLSTSPNTPTPTTGYKYADGVTPSPLTLTLQNFFSADTNTSSGASTNALLADYLIEGNASRGGPGPATATLGGLTPNASFNLYLYGSNGDQSDGGQFSVNGSATKTTSGNGGPIFTESVHYVRFLAVTANSGGKIAITVTEEPGATGLGIFNGFQLEAVPEPASCALIAFGGLGLLRRRELRRAE